MTGLCGGNLSHTSTPHRKDAEEEEDVVSGIKVELYDLISVFSIQKISDLTIYATQIVILNRCLIYSTKHYNIGSLRIDSFTTYLTPYQVTNPFNK